MYLKIGLVEKQLNAVNTYLLKKYTNLALLEFLSQDWDGSQRAQLERKRKHNNLDGFMDHFYRV